MADVDVPTSALRSAVVAGLLIETQVVPMDRAIADSVADRIIESVEQRRLAVLDRAKVSEWLEAIDAQVRPFLALHGRGHGICDVRGHHVMVAMKVDGWPYDVLVCEDCERATQVERDG